MAKWCIKCEGLIATQDLGFDRDTCPRCQAEQRASVGVPVRRKGTGELIQELLDVADQPGVLPIPPVNQKP